MRRPHSLFGLALAASTLAGTASAQIQQLSTNSGGGERHAVVNTEGSTVVYVAMRSGKRELMSVGVDGGTPKALTTGADVRVGIGAFDAWPSLSIDDRGRLATYWNAQGVHIVDLASGQDQVVAPAKLLPYPQFGSGSSGVILTYQDAVSGQLEVFTSALGRTPTQHTRNSGPGRRLPDLAGNLIVFQKLVQGQQELFLLDTVNNQLSGPLTQNSGAGNRYARFSPDGKQIVYEVVDAQAKEVRILDVATRQIRNVAKIGTIGDRLPLLSRHDEVFLQSSVTNLELHKTDTAATALTAMTTGSRAGLRRPSIDQWGSVVVYQAEQNGNNEVFRYRLCYAPNISLTGVNGTPSTGTLAARADFYRCALRTGFDSSLNNRPTVFLFGSRPLNTPLPGAPGNFLYVDPLVTVPMSTNAQGDVTLSIDLPNYSATGSLFVGQWAVLDRGANALGVVTTAAVRLGLQ